MSGPKLDDLAQFNAHRKRLLRELLALQAQLKGAVALPQLGPLQEQCSQLDELLASLQRVHQAHSLMLQRDLKKLDLQVRKTASPQLLIVHTHVDTMCRGSL